MKKKLTQKSFKTIIAIVLICFGTTLFGVNLNAQVSVSPTVLFVDQSTKTCSATLKNNSPTAKEIEISFKYGYSGLDSTGESSVLYNDTITSAEYSLAPYISSFPKRLVLQGNTEQTVRLLVRGLPENLSEKALWARMSVKAQDVAKQVDTNTVENISAQFVFVMETMNPVFYYNGNMNINIETSEIKSILADDKIHLDVECKRQGNAPFLGSAEIKIYDLSGKLIETQIARTAVYFTNKARFVFDKSVLKAGQYKAEIVFTNERDDIPQQYRIKFKPLTKLMDFTINY